MKTFVIGDIHGAYKALEQCLERSSFNEDQDRLIVLGDVCDRHPEVRLCIEKLLELKHCNYVIGNHDLWALDWALKGEAPEVWTTQGGFATMESYGQGWSMPKKHIDFLQNAYYWLECEGKLFVHGGFNVSVPLDQQDQSQFVWDRSLIQAAWKKSLVDKTYHFSSYEEIFLGHTPVQNFQSNVPLHLCNVWAMDTGAGWSGPLTIMDIHTKEYWQSDLVSKLYPH